MKNSIKYFVASLSVAASASPLLTFALGGGGGGAAAGNGSPTVPETPTVLKSLHGFKNFICGTVFGWFFTFLVVLAAMFALVAAYKYLTAGGDPEKVKAASNILIYAAIAIVAALFARGLPLLVASLVGTDATLEGGAGGAAC